MKYRKLSEDGDYTFGQGNANFLTGSDAILQAIKTKILLLKGEYWEDVNDGTPLFDDILKKRSDDAARNAIDIVVKNRIMEVEGVTSVSNFISKIEDRRYIATIDVQTIYSDLTNVSIEL